MEGAKWQAKDAPGRQRRSSSEPGQRAFASRGNDCAATVVVQRRYLVSARDHRARPPAKPTQGPGHGGPSQWQTVSLCCPKGHRCRAKSRPRRRALAARSVVVGSPRTVTPAPATLLVSTHPFCFAMPGRSVGHRRSTPSWCGSLRVAGTSDTSPLSSLVKPLTRKVRAKPSGCDLCGCHRD